MTVSRVLNHRPDVAPRPRRASSASSWRPGSCAAGRRAPKRGHRGLINLVVPDLESAYTLAIIWGVEEILEPAGLRLALSATYNEARRERQWLIKIADRSTDGAILVLPCGQSERLDEFHRRHIPFVAVDHRRELRTRGTRSRRHGLVRRLHGHPVLLSLGHQRIAFITGPASYGCSKERLGGYRAALEEAALPVDPQLIRPGEFRRHTGYEQTRALVDLPPAADDHLRRQRHAGVRPLTIGGVARKSRT